VDPCVASSIGEYLFTGLLLASSADLTSQQKLLSHKKVWGFSSGFTAGFSGHIRRVVSMFFAQAFHLL